MVFLQCRRHFPPCDSAGNPVPVPRWNGRTLSHNSTLFDIFPERPPEGRRKRQRHKFFDNFLLPRVIHIVHRVFHRQESVDFQRFPTPRKSYPRPFLPFFPPFSRKFSVFSGNFLWTSVFLHRILPPASKRQVPALYIFLTGNESSVLPIHFPRVTSFAQTEKRPEGRFSTFLFGFPQEKIREPGRPGNGWHRR